MDKQGGRVAVPFDVEKIIIPLHLIVLISCCTSDHQ